MLSLPFTSSLQNICPINVMSMHFLFRIYLENKSCAEIMDIYLGCQLICPQGIRPWGLDTGDEYVWCKPHRVYDSIPYLST